MFMDVPRTAKNNSFMNDFGKRVMARARELGIRSGAELARKIGYQPGQERAFGYYLTGRNQLDVDILLKLSKTLQVDINYLLGTMDEDEQELIDTIRQASPDQKAALLTLTRQFIGKRPQVVEDEEAPVRWSHAERRRR